MKECIFVYKKILAMEIENKDFSEEFESSPKKQWTKPECEIIGKDRINAGSISFVAEGAKSTFGLPGAGS
ncbi:hypothetical protein GVN16_20020 [Emticicia sp. CRIBPO]|nr:hypothetical protein [Emticicia sp. CRIBPO]